VSGEGVDVGGRRRDLCDHICMLDAGHVERGELHYYCYELPSPRSVDPTAALRDAALLAQIRQVVAETWDGSSDDEIQDAFDAIAALLGEQ
jgi:hypothetical protein